MSACFHHFGIHGWMEIQSTHKNRALALKPQGSLRFKTDARDSVQLSSKFCVSEGVTDSAWYVRGRHKGELPVNKKSKSRSDGWDPNAAAS